jgi:hypothetical protein
MQKSTSKADTMYTVSNFSETIIYECESLFRKVDESGINESLENNQMRRQLVTEKISRYINVQEIKNKNTTIQLVIRG